MIRVVLHQPQELPNIAQVVRAMKNFSLRDLVLVDPREFDAWRIEGIAHRTGDILERVRIVESLDDAIADCVHVAGLTARGRTAKQSYQRPREAAAEILEAEVGGTVAVLLGREDRGLPNEATDRCHRLVTIPADPEYSSLNLGHAAAIMFYELALARGAEARPLKAPRRAAPPATVEHLEQLFSDYERAMDAIDFFKTRRRETVMRTVRDVFHRAPLDEREAKLLRATMIEVWKGVERGERRDRGERGVAE